MAIPKKITNFLEKHNINYEILEHKTVYTAFDMAQTMKKKLSQIAKTLALKVDKKHILVVVPADRKVNFDKLKKLLKAKQIKIVKEIDMVKVFKTKKGNLLPFGTFHKVPVFIDKTLLKTRIIIVSGGSYTESLKLKAMDLLEHGGEALTAFSKQHKFKKARKIKPKKKKTVAKKAARKKPTAKKIIKSKPAKKRKAKK
ncbi:MAG: YbaK/EbsC family protein [Patescibacteria group bacterium]|nr:YbaK/EbsC family protein [Patescibacteria group bacterium]